MQHRMMILCLLVIWSALNVQCEDYATRFERHAKQHFIYDGNGVAKMNFFTRERWTYVRCMKFCQKMGGRSPPVRNKTEQGEMVGMLEDLRAFPHFPKELFLSVTGG